MVHFLLPQGFIHHHCDEDLLYITAESRKSPEKVTENRKSPIKNQRRAGKAKQAAKRGKTIAAENRKRQSKAAEKQKRTPYNRLSMMLREAMAPILVTSKGGFINLCAF